MILLKQIKGQNNAVRLLSNILAANNISKSYLFSGPYGVGKALTARSFLSAMLCREKVSETEACLSCTVCNRIETGEHPDIHWISPEKNKSIKIDEIRKLRDLMNLKPYESVVNAGIVEEAHLMTIEAQNALLKILEEPPGDSLLILITNKKELLLPTVISRCSEVRFNFLAVNETAGIVSKETGMDRRSAELISYFSQGSPGSAMDMVEEGVLERKQELIGLVGDMTTEKDPGCLNWDTEDKNVLYEDIEMLIMFLRDVLFGIEGYQDRVLDKTFFDTELYGYFSRCSAGKIHDIVIQLIKIKKALSGNVNSKIVAQVLPGILMG